MYYCLPCRIKGREVFGEKVAEKKRDEAKVMHRSLVCDAMRLGGEGERHPEREGI